MIKLLHYGFSKILDHEKKSNFLFMLFDFGDDWVFRINKTRKNAELHQNVTYPRIIEHIGKNPVQYPMCEDA